MKNKSVFILSLFVVCCLLAIFISGCGYTTRSMIASNYKTIYVTPFVNKINITNEVNSANKYRIYRPMIESDITNYVNNKYLFDGNLKPANKDFADLILKGEVMEFRKDPLRYDNNDEVSEYRINLVVNISLWDRVENKMLWEEKNFIGDTTYFPIGPQSETEDNAIVDALTDLSRRVVERTVEQW